MKIGSTFIQSGYKYTALVMGLLLLAQDIQAQILNEDYAAGADVLILKNEMDIFSSIQQGVKLSVTECELFDSCSASVNRDELNQLITTINGRINSLSIRYTDSGEAALEEVLVGYVDLRDGYNQILEKIETLPQFEQQQVTDEFSVDDFFSFGPVPVNEVSDEIQELFEDVDENLTNDDIILDEEIPSEFQ
jgi:hypothetical protein